MQSSQRLASYGATAKAFHWFTAVLLIAQVAIALRAWKTPAGDARNELLSVHMFIGLTILVITILRLVWRGTHLAPALPTTMRPATRALARGTQYVFYVLLLVLPFTGWALLNSAGVPVRAFGVLELPNLVAANSATLKQLKLTHLTLNTLLFAALFLHWAGAARHAWLLKDGVVGRMLPDSWRRS
jgi:cytochrome b561